MINKTVLVLFAATMGILNCGQVYSFQFGFDDGPYQQSAENFVERLDMKYGRILVGIVANKTIQEDIEVLDYQVEEIRTLVSAAEKHLSEKMKANQALRNSEGDDAFQLANVEAIRNSQKEIDDGIGNVLVPHQVKELKRSFRWLVIESMGSFATFFQVDEVKKTLEIDESQLKDIKELDQKLQSEFEKELLELKEKYRKKLTDSLKKDQQKKLEEMLGKTRSYDTGAKTRY